MANYSISGWGSASPYQANNGASYGSWYDSLPNFGQLLLGANPEGAYQQWLNLLGPMSFSQNQTLQKLYNQIYQTFQGKLANNPNLQFGDFLKGVNANQLTASVPAPFRVNSERQNYAPPIRWVAGF